MICFSTLHDSVIARTSLYNGWLLRTDFSVV